MINLRVMNDFSHNEQPAIFENLASSIGQIDRALHAVTEAKLLGQSHSGVSNRNDSAGAPDFFDDVAAIVRLDLLLHRRHYVGSTQVHFLARSRAARNQRSEERRVGKEGSTG